MFTDQMFQRELSGILVRDAVIVLQLIRRFIESGQLKDVELVPVAMLRTNLINQIQLATGVNYDNPQPTGAELGPSEMVVN